MKFKIFKHAVILLAVAIAFAGCDANKEVNGEEDELPTLSNFNDPLIDLPWLKTKVEEFISLTQGGTKLTVAIFQCEYDNGKAGFLIDQGNIKPFYSCDGSLLCTLGGFVGETCPELKIDLKNKKLIWYLENGFINGVCEFSDPLEDLQWLKSIVEEFTDYSNSVSKRHFQIYQCTFVEESDEKIGFIVTPICVDCSSETAMLYRCTGIKLCSMGEIMGVCDEFNIANKELIWEINN